jgi:hypothetical protein
MITYENTIHTYHQEGLDLLHSLEASVGSQELHVVQPKEYTKCMYNRRALLLVTTYCSHQVFTESHDIIQSTTSKLAMFLYLNNTPLRLVTYTHKHTYVMLKVLRSYTVHAGMTYRVCRCSFEFVPCICLCSLPYEVLEAVQSVVACSLMNSLNPILITW